MTKTDHYEPMRPKCPHKDKCASYPKKCDNCKNNPIENYHKPRNWAHPWPKGKFYDSEWHPTLIFR